MARLRPGARALGGCRRRGQGRPVHVDPGESGRAPDHAAGGHPLDRYSTDAEVQKLSGVLANKGPEAFRSALWDLEKGYIRIGNGLGYPITVATSKPTAQGRRIRLMMDRPVSFREFANSARSLDYPFSYVEINLGKGGKGEGQMFAAARISLTAGTVDVENYSFQPLKLLAVRAR
jgi:hypothetical protein